uniref:Uncharacterized protein n=1 Tax=Parascaris univalens TaxID=6257 RepID=A0A915A5L9_PARUN
KTRWEQPHDHALMISIIKNRCPNDLVTCANGLHHPAHLFATCTSCYVVAFLTVSEFGIILQHMAFDQ